MYRGTTPTLELRLKTLIDFNEIDKIYITLASMLNELTISEDRCTFDNENKTIQFTLTQEETLSFNVSTVEIQARIRLKDGKSYATSIAKADMLKILKDGVI